MTLKDFNVLLEDNMALRRLLREAMFMHPGARITERVVKVDESAGSDYEIDWSDKFKEIAKLADVDLSKYDPCVYLR